MEHGATLTPAPRISVFRLAWKNPGFVLFSTGWTAAVALIFFVSLPPTIKQWGTWRYTETRGEITHSAVQVERDESTQYALDVLYTYSVDHKVYIGDVLKYDANASKDQARVNALLARFAEGKTVPVYYDPHAPGEAVLVRGEVALRGFTFAIVFAVTVVGFCIGTWQAIRFHCSAAPAAALPIARRRGVLRVEIFEQTAVLATIIWGLLCFCIFALGYWVNGSDTSNDWIVLLLQLLAPLPLFLMVSAAVPTLALDERARMLSVSNGGKLIASCPYDAVRALWLRGRSELQARWSFRASGASREVGFGTSSCWRHWRRSALVACAQAKQA
jgi:hypothetical protein